MGAGGSLPPLGGRRILVIRAGALGDTLLLLPAVAVLREGVGPEGRVEILGRAPGVELARGAALAARVYHFDRALFRAFFNADVDASELQAFLGDFDTVVSFSRLPRLRALLDGLGAGLVEAEPLPPAGVHASDHFLLALAPLGLRAAGRSPELAIPPAEGAEASRWLESRGLREGCFAAIHPSSGSPRKNWPPDRFRELAARGRAHGLDVVWIEGEADGQAVAQARGAAPDAVARGLELPVLAALLARAAVYIGNDSGVSHLAAAVSAPTLAVFGPTDPAQWAPRGPRVTVVDWGRLPEEAWGFALTLMAKR